MGRYLSPRYLQVIPCFDTLDTSQLIATWMWFVMCNDVQLTTPENTITYCSLFVTQNFAKALPSVSLGS